MGLEEAEKIYQEMQVGREERDIPDDRDSKRRRVSDE